jgi:alkylhydroperoxidase family enzyme
MNQRLNFAEAAPEVFEHLSALDQHIGAHVEHPLLELVKLRASMINGCAFCVDTHSADALKGGCPCLDVKRLERVFQLGVGRRRCRW